MNILKIKGDLKYLLKYGFKEIQYISGKVYGKNLENGNNYRVSEKDGGILHYNQNTVYNEIDDTILGLIRDGMVEIQCVSWTKLRGNNYKL